MKPTNVLLLFLFVCLSFQSQAQLANGSMAPDMTVTDINGASHDLYGDYLDNGISVVLDLSATWCPPCWSFHNSGTMTDLYDDYGPGSSEYMLMPMMVEVDPGTNQNCFYGPVGCVGGTEGDWSGHPYPLCNPPSSEASTINNDFQVSFFPTIYVIAPSGYVTLSPSGGGTSYDWLESWGIGSYQMELSTWTVLGDGCGEGSIDFHTNQGYGTVDYLWSNGATTEDLTNVPNGDYSVTLTDDNGFTVEFGPIEVESSPAMYISNSNITNVDCYSNDNGAISITAAGGTEDFSYEWSNGDSGPSISNLYADDYEVTITDENTDCELIEEIEVEEPDEIEVEYDVTDAGCSGTPGQIEFNNDGGVYPFSYLIDGNTYTVDVISLPAGTYNADIYDSNNCYASATFTITEEPTPVATSAVTGELDCSGTPVYLDGNGSSTGPDIRYAWYDASGIYITDQIQFQVNNPGLYTLYVTNDDNGCYSTSTTTVIGNVTIPTAVITQQGNLDCSTTTITLSSTGSSSGSNISYEWTASNGGTIVGSNTQPTVTISSGGTYALTVINTNNSCQQVTSTAIAQTASPNLLWTGDVSFCQGSTTNLCVTQGANQSVQWLQNGSVVSNAACFATASSGTYTAILTDNVTGCSSLQEITTTANAVPSAAITGDLSFCSGNSANLCHNNQGGIAYSWVLNNVSYGNSNCITVNQAGQLSLSTSDPVTGCSASEQITITENAIPLNSLSTPDGTEINCSTQSVNLDLTMDPTSTVAWYDENGTFISATEDLVVTDGTYTYYVTSSAGCQAQGSVNVTVIPDEIPQSSLATPDGTEVNCNTQSVTLDLTVDPTSTVAWYDGNGTLVGSTEDILVGAGTYTYYVTSSEGCQGQGAINVTADTNVPTVSINPPSTITCSDPSTTLSFSTNATNYTAVWQNESGQQLSGSNPTVDSGGTYTVTLTNDNGCTTQASVVVETNGALPDIQVSGDPFIGCTNPTATLTVEGDLAGNTITWTDNQGNIVGTSSSITVTQSGSYSVVVSPSPGCFTEAGILISDLGIDPVQSVFETNNSLLDFSFSNQSAESGTMTYSWDFGDGNTSSDQNPNHTYANPGNYNVCLTVTNECGSSTECQTVSATTALAYSSDIEDITCHGGTDGSILISISGGTPMYTYTWSDPDISGMGATGLSAGSYDVTVTDASGLSVVIENTLTEPEQISSSATITPTSITEANGSISLAVTGGTGDYQVVWEDGSTGFERTGLAQGDYMAQITDSNGCQVVSTFTVTGTSDIIEITSLESLNVSPNPASNFVTIEAEFSTALNLNLKLINTKGERILNENFRTDGFTRQYDLSDIPAGVYLLELRSGQQITNRKIIVTK